MAGKLPGPSGRVLRQQQSFGYRKCCEPRARITAHLCEDVLDVC